ncbi:MAG: HNH endonuclease signature motif containing protein [Aeromonas popoffii]|uniref:HNH endonuclease signature motif containing protein n=1 Tax=Aeromonas popoffii TaxID=70856 RepID=UPI003F2F82FB
MAYERDYKQERKTAIARGETGCGSKSGDATRHRARRKVEKRVGRKLATDEHVDHKKPLKSGGSNNSANLRVRPASKNQSDGGKSGDTKGKAAGGKKGGSARMKKKPS